MPATTDIRGTSSPRSLSQNVVRGLAFEYEHEVLKGQYPQILTVRYRFPHGRPGSVHSGFKLSDHIVQAPPTLVATTSSLIYDVLVYSQIIHSTNPNPDSGKLDRRLGAQEYPTCGVRSRRLSAFGLGSRLAP